MWFTSAEKVIQMSFKYTGFISSSRKVQECLAACCDKFTTLHLFVKGSKDLDALI